MCPYLCGFTDCRNFVISIRAVSLVREIHNLQISGNTSLLVMEDFSNKTIYLDVFENF